MKHLEMKIDKIVLVISVAILCCGLFTACGSKKGEDALVGTWYYDENDAVELVFYKDGSYRHGNKSVQVAGDYKLVSENEIELTSNESGLGADMWHVAGIHKFSLEDGTLIIESGGAAGEYHKSK